MNKILLATAFVMALGMTACGENPTSDQQQHQAQEQISKQGNMVVGMPAIINFTEKKLMKMILEKRDDPKLVTYTYITDLNGNLHLRCRSIGYGLPYGTQYTNPQRVTGGFDAPSTGNVTIPQADPNGLFSPASAEGTWVLCKDPKSENLEPVYFEDRVTVSPFELQ